MKKAFKCLTSRFSNRENVLNMCVFLHAFLIFCMEDRIFIGCTYQHKQKIPRQAKKWSSTGFEQHNSE